MMSFDFYPDAVTVQTDVVTQGGGTSGVAPVGSGDMYPDTDAFWGGGFSEVQERGSITDYSTVFDDLPDNSVPFGHLSVRRDSMGISSSQYDVGRDGISGRFVQDIIQDTESLSRANTDTRGLRSYVDKEKTVLGLLPDSFGLREPVDIKSTNLFEPRSIISSNDFSPLRENPQNWISLWKSPPWAQFLGRAFGVPEYPKGQPCTYWLGGGDLLISAAHCRDNMGIDPVINFSSAFSGCQLNRTFNRDFICWTVPSVCPTVKFSDRIVSKRKNVPFLFGLKPGTDSQYEKLALRAARERMIDLGVPEHSVRNDPLYLGNSLTRFSCDLRDSSFRKSDGCRDIDFFQCGRKTFSFKSFDSLVNDENFTLLPSAIYGSVPIDILQKIKVGEEYSVISFNQRAQDVGHIKKPLHMLYSPSGKIESVDPLGSYFQGRGAYFFPGSSGAPAIDPVSKRALGIASFQWFNIGTLDTDEFTTIPGRLFKYLDPWPFHSFSSNVNVLGSVKNSNRVGKGKANSPVSLSCPRGYAVAGLVASTISDRITPRFFIGNLGLVCLPFSRDYQFEHAVVIAGGSVDTSEKSSGPIGQTSRQSMPFDVYMVEHFTSGGLRIPPKKSTRSLLMKPQSFQMCPPNYFLQEVSVQERFRQGSGLGYIQTVHGLECRRFDQTKKSYPVKPRLPMGDRRFTNLSKVQCPAGSFVTGMNIWVDQYTNAFEFKCSEPPQVRGMTGGEISENKSCEPWELCGSAGRGRKMRLKQSQGTDSLWPDVILS